MKASALALAAALLLAGCGGTNSDEDKPDTTPAPGMEGLGENGAMANDMTTANDVAISNQL